MAQEYGYDSKLLKASLEVNNAQRHMVIQKLQEKLYILKGRTIGLLGLAFKPDTDDLRDAPSLYIAERLLQMGARVKAYDPIAMNACKQQRSDLKIRYCESVQEVAQESNALVVVTEWSEFRALDLPALAAVMANPILVDGRNIFRPETAAAAGFDYTGVGRNARPRQEIGTPAAVRK
jgi:UDPglucose 6-dehydrogenase